MTDFIININEICPKENMEVIEWWGKKLDVIENYAKFLKQPLKLGHSQSKIAKIFKINRNVVLNISQNKTYKNIA